MINRYPLLSFESFWQNKIHPAPLPLPQHSWELAPATAAAALLAIKLPWKHGNIEAAHPLVPFYSFPPPNTTVGDTESTTSSHFFSAPCCSYALSAPTEGEVKYSLPLQYRDRHGEMDAVPPRPRGGVRATCVAGAGTPTAQPLFDNPALR
ncbi:hypothetical protein NDU88_004391 [Pleurodeles waltl]|uniref:Uncharacterized protein n=1 Tax=Pleurodeles waltl TaxID=8319 RepID=A0AAV7MV06_PLEWA|nr:hypothetical protein NDU88_004391 [Pleurodeles waltl]